MPLSAAVVELPTLLSELSPSKSRSSLRKGKRGAEGGPEDIELNNDPSVVGREAGETDPLQLRDKIVPDEDITSLKQCVLLYVQEPLTEELTM